MCFFTHSRLILRQWTFILHWQRIALVRLSFDLWANIQWFCHFFYKRLNAGFLNILIDEILLFDLFLAKWTNHWRTYRTLLNKRLFLILLHLKTPGKNPPIFQFRCNLANNLKFPFLSVHSIINIFVPYCFPFTLFIK